MAAFIGGDQAMEIGEAHESSDTMLNEGRMASSRTRGDMAAENWERDGRGGGGTPLPRVPWRRSGLGLFFLVGVPKCGQIFSAYRWHKA
jgi:hypothetical protein